MVEVLVIICKTACTKSHQRRPKTASFERTTQKNQLSLVFKFNVHSF